MSDGLKNLIKECNKIIKKENIKINSFQKQIREYESVISIISKLDDVSIEVYREQINNYYLKIDRALEKVKYNRDIIAKIKMSNQIIRRGENVA